MKFKWLLLVGLLISGMTFAQQCPEGIPSAGNPQCLPPQDERSPYHDASGYGPEQQQAATPVWAARWGAIASDGNGTYGIVTDLPTKRKAQKAAVEECKNRGGADCVVKRDYHNQCAAVVLSDARSAYANAPSRDEAVEIGQRDCAATSTGSCRVYWSGCSTAVRVQ